MKHIRSKKGFTVVELVIVIAVIGILTALAFTGWSAWRASLAKKEVKSDLGQVVSAMNNYRNFNNAYPVLQPGCIFDKNATNNCANSLFSSSSGVTVTYTSGTSSTFCIDGVSNSSPSITFFVKEDGQTTNGTCAGGVFDSGLADERAMPTSYDATALRVNPSDGQVYFIRPNSGGLYRYNVGSATQTLVAAGVYSDAMDFGSDGYVYAFSNFASVSGAVNLVKIDPSSGTIQTIGTAVLSEASALDVVGNEIYMGGTNPANGRRGIFSFDMTQSTFSVIDEHFGSAVFAPEGVLRTGDNVYWNVRGSATDSGLYVTTLPSKTTTKIASAPPLSAIGWSPEDLQYLNGNLYVYSKGSFYKFTVATSTWSVAKANVSYDSGTASSSCSYPAGFDFYQGRYYYITDPNGTACASSTKKLMTPAI